VTNFQTWEQHNLAKFAREANEKLLAQQKEIEQLHDDALNQRYACLWTKEQIVNGLPAKYFAFPPYRAEDLGGKMGWWGVMNKSGFNCLTFPDKPGAVVTSEANAKRLADEWNKE